MEYYFKGSSKLKNSRRPLNRRKKRSSTVKAPSLVGRLLRLISSYPRTLIGGLSSFVHSGGFRRVALGVVVVLAVVVSSTLIIREAYSYKLASSSAEPSLEEEPRYVPTLLTTEFTIKKNDSVYAILSTLGLDHAKITDITDKAKPFYDLKRVREGDVVRVATIDGRFERLE